MSILNLFEQEEFVGRSGRKLIVYAYDDKLITPNGRTASQCVIVPTTFIEFSIGKHEARKAIFRVRAEDLGKAKPVFLSFARTYQKRPTIPEDDLPLLYRALADAGVAELINMGQISIYFKVPLENAEDARVPRLPEFPPAPKPQAPRYVSNRFGYMG